MSKKKSVPSKEYRSWSPNRPVKPESDPMLPDLSALILRDERSWYGKANASGLAPTTLRNLAMGVTRRPQALTVQMAYAMLGMELVPRRIRNPKE